MPHVVAAFQPTIFTAMHRGEAPRCKTQKRALRNRISPFLLRGVIPKRAEYATR
jgi:hypothetical protein